MYHSTSTATDTLLLQITDDHIEEQNQLGRGEGGLGWRGGGGLARWDGAVGGGNTNVTTLLTLKSYNKT